MSATAATGVGKDATVTISSVGSNDIALQGGTLQIDKPGSYSNKMTLQSSSSGTIISTIDAHGNVAKLSGVIANDSSNSFQGTLAFSDSVGGGQIIISGANTYTGATTIASGTSVAISGTGSLASSSSILNNGTFDISQAATTVSVASLAGAGAVALGSNVLTITNGSSTFSGVISGAGSLLINGGTQVLEVDQTYTGGTTIARGTLQLGASGSRGMILGNVVVAGTLAFSRADDFAFTGLVSGTGGVSQIGSGSVTLTQVETYSGTTTISYGSLVLSPGASIRNSAVATDGTFDISQTGGTSIRALTGTGSVSLGASNLTLTAGNGTFSGIITGTGGVTLDSGTQILAGQNTYTGATVVNGGTLEVAASNVGYNVTNSGTFGFYSTGAINMSGVVSGSGALLQAGTGATTLTAAQAYTGITTISAGTLALSGNGSISSSSNVIVNGTFSIAARGSGSAITSLDGSGNVQIGSQDLTLTQAAGTFGGGVVGTGNLILAGGKETFSGTSSLTGSVLINGGTLVIASPGALSTAAKIVNNSMLDVSAVSATGIQTSTSIASLSGTGIVALGATTLILSNASDTFTGSISGSGGLTLTAGTEILTGANSSTGGTTIRGGTLRLSGGGRLAATSTVSNSGTFDISSSDAATVTIGSLAGNGVVTLGSKNLSLTAAADTFSGQISGTGGLSIGGGSQTLAGSNSYTGGTSITSTLQLGNGVTGGTVVGDIQNSGSLVFNQPSATVVANTISGGGRVTQSGTGTIALTGSNSYSGGTFIDSGTLQIGNGGASGSLTGDVTNNGTLAFNRSDASSFAGTISGSGSVQVANGDLTLLTANSYSGVTTISNPARLRLSGLASIASSSDVIDNGVLDLSGAVKVVQLSSLSGSGSIQLGMQSLEITTAADSFFGTIAGTGGVALVTGSETLSGTNSYTGATTVRGGTLTINGSIANSSDVSVQSGGTLAGSGTVTSINVGSGGTLAPTGGTLKATGNVTLAAGSKYVVQLGSASQSGLSADGSASLGGTLYVTSDSGGYLIGQSVTILTAQNGISGQFTVQPIARGTGAEFAAKATYSQNSVQVRVDLSKLSPALSSSATFNQAAVVAGVDKGLASGATVPSGINTLGNLSESDLALAADNLAGEVGADLGMIAQNAIAPLLNSIADHTAEVRRSRFTNKSEAAGSMTLWTSAALMSQAASGNAALGSHKLSANGSSVLFGGDWHISNRVQAGLVASYAHETFRVGSDLGSGADNAIQLAAYGDVQFGRRIYGSLLAAGSFDSVHTNRKILSTGENLTGRADLTSMVGRYETGILTPWLAPYMAVDGSFSRRPSYAETSSFSNSSYALSYRTRSELAAALELGGRQDLALPMGKEWTLKLTDRLAWRYQSAARAQADASFTALSGSNFAIYGANPAGNSALISLGARLANRHGLNLGLRMDTAASSHGQSYAGSFELGLTW